MPIRTGLKRTKITKSSYKRGDYMRNSAVTVTISGEVEKPYEEIDFGNQKAVIFKLKLKISSSYYFINILSMNNKQADNIRNYIIPENIGKELIVIGDLVPSTEAFGCFIFLSKIIFAHWFISAADVEKEKANKIDLSDTDDFFNEGKNIG